MSDSHTIRAFSRVKLVETTAHDHTGRVFEKGTEGTVIEMSFFQQTARVTMDVPKGEPPVVIHIKLSKLELVSPVDNSDDDASDGETIDESPEEWFQRRKPA